MPVYDRRCTACGHLNKDVIEKISSPDYPCDQDLCDGIMERAWLPGAANGVKDDSIPGGLEIKNALCHPDGTPRRFDSWTDINREAKRSGWTNHVEHIGQNGTDKSKHTVRWAAAPLMGKQEEERVAAWHAHERQFSSPSS
jgi:hypothetical protein